MNRALAVAASGMAAQQANLEIIAHNLANSDVTAFKGLVATFAELSAGGAHLGTLQVGTHPVFAQGKLVKSGGPFDVAIDGDGFFEVRRGARVAYTRDGEFSRAADGTVRNAAGWALQGAHIPADAIAVRVERDGRVVADLPHHPGRTVGRICPAIFPAPYGLEALGNNLFAATAASGAPRHVAAGIDAGPQIAFGTLERSNVSVVDSMMQILSAQRAYEANAKGVQAADEMLRIVNNLHRD